MSDGEALDSRRFRREVIQMLHGQILCVVIDDGAANRTSSGLIRLLMHVGSPMKLDYRDFCLKTL